MIEGEHGLGVFGVRAQRRCVRRAGWCLNVAACVCGVDDARNQALGLINIQTGSAAGQAVGLEAVENARDTRAINADGAELIGVCEDLVRLAL